MEPVTHKTVAEYEAERPVSQQTRDLYYEGARFKFRTDKNLTIFPQSPEEEVDFGSLTSPR
jgi:hypothetical protein